MSDPESMEMPTPCARTRVSRGVSERPTFSRRCGFRSGHRVVADGGGGQIRVTTDVEPSPLRWESECYSPFELRV